MMGVKEGVVVGGAQTSQHLNRLDISLERGGDVRSADAGLSDQEFSKDSKRLLARSVRFPSNVCFCKDHILSRARVEWVALRVQDTRMYRPRVAPKKSGSVEAEP